MKWINKIIHDDEIGKVFIWGSIVGALVGFLITYLLFN
jgi:hypothetical protein